MVALSFYESFHLWKKNFENTCHKFFANFSFALLESRRSNLHVYFRLFCQTRTTEKRSLNRKDEDTCDNCGFQTTKLKIALSHEEMLSWNLVLYPISQLSTNSHDDLTYHIAIKHSAPKPEVTIKCKLSYDEFPVFYALRQH